MLRREVSCITKNSHSSTHNNISHIGGKISDGTKWRLSQEEAISLIERETYEFYVTKNGKSAKVIIRKTSLGHKYLRTVSDETLTDNLLSLPECQ